MIKRRPHTERKRSLGFSLVEVTMALAIIAFASASIISLIPFGLTSFRHAMNNTVESEIVQTLTNDLAMTDFKNLSKMAGAGGTGTTYYFDANGDPAGATSYVYKAQISFTDLSAAAPLSNLTTTSGTTALITITKIDQTKDYFSMVLGNNQQVN